VGREPVDVVDKRGLASIRASRRWRTGAGANRPTSTSGSGSPRTHFSWSDAHKVFESQHRKPVNDARSGGSSLPAWLVW